MEVKSEFSAFIMAVLRDHRIGPTHIALYAAIFHLYEMNGTVNPVPVTRSLIMNAAKIYGVATYHKCLRDLVHGGYVRYEPSFDGRVMSKVWVVGVRDGESDTDRIQSDKIG